MRVTVLVSGDTPRALSLAAAWQRAGDAVTLVLLDAAAAVVRPGHADAPGLRATCAAGVTVAAHDAALRRRGLEPGAADVVQVIDLDAVVDLITGADKAVWL